MDVGWTGQGLDRALAHVDHGDHGGYGQQHVERASDQIHPEIADGGRLTTGEASHQGDRDLDSHRGADELLHRQSRHLREVRHGRLAGVVLPVGVGDERDGRVQCQQGRYPAHVLRIEGQRTLEALDRVHQEHSQGGEDDGRTGVARPRLLRLGVNPQHHVDGMFQPTKPVGLAAVDVGHVGAEEAPGQSQDGDQDQEGNPEAHQNRSGRSSANTRYTKVAVAITSSTMLPRFTAAGSNQRCRGTALRTPLARQARFEANRADINAASTAASCASIDRQFRDL